MVAHRGPFSLEDNLVVLRQREIGIVVTKDSGEAGGLPEKLEAARRCGCQVVVVGRPQPPQGVFHSIEALKGALRSPERLTRAP